MRAKGVVKTLLVFGFGFDIVLSSALLPRQDRRGGTTSAVVIPPTTVATQVAQTNAGRAGTGTSPISQPPPPPTSAAKPATDESPAPSLPPLTTTLVTSAQSDGGTATDGAKATGTGNSTTEDPTASATPSETDAGSVPVPTGFLTGNTTVPLDPNGLPFTPVITPAMGVAGVLLLITGVPFALVGYRYQTMNIFLSTCYLTTLSVAVLIVYVMNPPVSNALQGGYLVACVFTGLLLGGLAMVFPEILESMNCVLGGFCLSMWFLTLKPDGLITSVIGKVIFILCITLLMWSVAFLSILKRGGMIFSMSFAGATIIVLGIDCFSRVGMKEFWLYIWDLNDNIFPVGRDKSFAHTRGIRVEIAAIVIITLVGIVSQAKLWKLIKERRKEWREGKFRHPLARSRREAGHDRSVEPKEESSSRDQVRWEDARYSRMPSTTEIDQIQSGISSRRNSRRPISDAAISRDSGIGSDEANKSSVRDVASLNRSSKNVNIPMLDLDFAGSRSRQPSPAPSSRRKRNSGREGGEEMDARASRASLAPGSTVVAIDTNNQNASHTIIIPQEDDESDRSSVATAAASTPASQRNSRHLSVQSLGEIMKNKPVHDDDNSSIAATLDQDESSEDNLPLVGSEPGSPKSRRASILSIGGHSKRASIADSIKRSLSGRRNSVSKKESPSRSNSTRKGSKEEKSDFLKPYDIALPSSPSLDSPSSAFQELERKSTADSSMLVERPGTSNNRPESRSVTRPVAPLREETLQDVRPPSRLVKTFRTNEWAKHLEDAEAPEVEAIDYLELSASPVPGDNERVAPVNFAELQHGISAPHIPAPAPILSRSASRVSVDTRQLSMSPAPLSPSMPRSPTSPISPTSPAIGPGSLMVPANAMPSNIRQNSMSPPPLAAPPALAHRTSLRSTSTPMITEAITESPLTDLRSSWREMTPSPIPVYSGDPLLKRESMLRSTPNLLNTRESIVPTYAIHSVSTTSLPKRASSGARRSFADDDISRKNLPMQHSVMRPVTAQGSSPRLSGSGFPSRPSTRQGQLERERQKQMLQQWHETMRHENIMGHHNQSTFEGRRTEMITERQLAAQQEKQREIAAIYRDNFREDQMKQRDMQELHRQALRKMQAGAKITKK